MKRLAKKPPKNREKSRTSPPVAIPVEETNLTPEERAMLPDPNWLTEDDADAIASLRAQAEGGQRIPFREYLKKHGHRGLDRW